MSYIIKTDDKNIPSSDAIDLYSKVGWGDEEDYTQKEMKKALENTTFFSYCKTG